MNKLIAFVLVGSLALNGGLLAKYFSRSSTSAARPNDLSSTVDQAPNGPASAALAAALASGDPAALAAAGFSAADIRDFNLGRAYVKLVEQSRAFRSASAKDGKYWKNNSSNPNNVRESAQQRAAMAKAQRQFADAMRSALGDESADAQTGTPRIDFLSPAKQTELRRIEQDYNDMTSEIYREQAGIQLPSDEAKLKLLRDEKERDIAAALSPEEREQYDLHLSPSAAAVRASYGDVIQNEDDYKKIFALRKAYDDQYRNAQRAGEILSPAQANERAEAQKQLDLQIRAVIGEDNLAASRQANDPDLKLLSALQTRLNIPAVVTDQIYASRENYAAQTQAIFADSNLTTEQQRAQITALGTQAVAEITTKIGKDGADAYAQRSSWIQMLKSGAAFSTNPKDSPNGIYNGYNAVFPLSNSKKLQMK